MTTLSTNLSSNGTGTGAQTSFPFSFRFISQTDIDVTVAGVAKLLGTDYTVQPNAVDGYGVGVDNAAMVGLYTSGNIVFAVAPANGAAIVISRNMDLTQEIALVRSTGFNATNLEIMSDKLTLIAQQLAAAISSAGVAGPGVAVGDNSIVLWNGTGGATIKDGVALGTSGWVLTSQGAGFPPVFSAAAGGSGTVTNFSAGDLSPLFTTSEATTTSTPALTFTLSNAAANTVFGNNTGSTAAPAFQSLVNAQLPTVDTTHGGSGNDWSAITAGRLPYFTGTGVLGTLAVGTNTHVLTLAAGVPTWADPATAGTVTNFSAGDLPPLFTTSEATTTSTPALTFTLSNAAANTVFGNNTGSTAAPAFQTMAIGQVPLITVAKGGFGADNSAVTAGRLPYFTGTGAIGTLAVGTDTHVLTLASGVPTWAAPATAGTVTNFSAGDLSPLFTTSEATTTSTPALTFTLSNAAANTVFGNNTGSTAAPAFQTMAIGQVPLITVAKGGFGADNSAVTAGRLPYFTGTGAIGTLAVGTDGHILTLASGLPVWAPNSGGGGGGGDFYGPGSAADHGIVFFDTTTGKLGKDMGGLGTSGHVLTSQGAGAMPIWSAVSGTGTVTDFSAGDLSPLFTTSEATTTTTPALTFTLSNAAANTVFGNNTGSTAAPGFQSLVNAQLPVVDTTHGGTGVDWSAITAGRLPYFTGTGILGTLAVGTDTHVLTLASGVPTWAAPSGGGSGTVTDFSAGDLSPLFTTSEASTTTTPALTFTLSNAAANTVFGNNTGSTAAPAFQTMAIGQVPLITVAKGGFGADNSAVTAGRLPYFTGTGVLGTLAVGTNTHVLTLAAGVPTWAAPATAGTVTNFSAGDLSPLFTTSEATTTSTPALTFTLSNAAANTVFGNNTGSTAAPAFQTMAIGQVPLITVAKGGFGADNSAVTAGRLPYFTGTGAIGTLAVGTNGHVLTLASGVPSWAASPSLTLPPTAKTSSFTGAWGESYPVSTSGGAVVMTMPAATGSGKFIYVSLETAGNNLTIDRAGSDTMSGQTSIVIASRYNGVLLHDIASGIIAVM